MEQIDKNVFDPALLSFPDCDFLIAHAGEAPVVAVRSIPPECNRTTVLQWIERFYELDELNRARGLSWIGVPAVKASIENYLKIRATWKAEEAFGAPKNPSMYAFDSRGNAYEAGPGSDSGRVRTYFDESGNRIPFAINLVQSGTMGSWKPSWVGKKTESGDSPSTLALIYPEGKNCIECGVPACGHTETYRPESRSSFNAARARMSRHLRSAKNEPQVHLELHTLEFASASKTSHR